MAKYLEIHALHTLPASNINRDGDGRPKTVTYGGTMRARVSSQAWKRVIREEFRKRIDTNMLGIRSREITGLIADRLGSSIEDKRLFDASTKLIEALGLKVDTDKDTKYKGNCRTLQFLGEPQWAMLADIVREAMESDDPKTVIKTRVKEAKKLISSDRSIDIALFGRMAASDDAADTAAYTVDAACQMAHAFTVNPIRVEQDYFTAVDDHDGSSGAGMLGDTGYISGTFYRWTSINIDLLDRNLAGDRDALKTALTEFMRAFVTTIPNGKINSFGHDTLPTLIVADVREDRPINLSDMYEDAIEDNIMDEATLRLFNGMTEVETMFGVKHPSMFVSARGAAKTTMGDNGLDYDIIPVPQLIDNTVAEAMR